MRHTVARRTARTLKLPAEVAAPNPPSIISLSRWESPLYTVLLSGNKIMIKIYSVIKNNDRESIINIICQYCIT